MLIDCSRFVDGDMPRRATTRNSVAAQLETLHAAPFCSLDLDLLVTGDGCYVRPCDRAVPGDQASPLGCRQVDQPIV